MHICSILLSLEIRMFHSQSGMKITAFLTNTPSFSNQLLQLHDKHHFSIISWLNVRWSKSFANLISSLNSYYITQAAIHSPYYIHYNLYFVVHDTNSISRVSEFPIKIAGEKKRRNNCALCHSARTLWSVNRAKKNTMNSIRMFSSSLLPFDSECIVLKCVKPVIKHYLH